MDVIEQTEDAELLPPQVGQNTALSTNKYPQLRPPWQPGQSGNPGGRPKGTLTRAYADVLKSKDPKTGKIIAEIIADAITAKAAKGDVAAASELADRTEGKPLQQQQVELSLVAPQGLQAYDPAEE